MNKVLLMGYDKKKKELYFTQFLIQIILLELILLFLGGLF